MAVIKKQHEKPQLAPAKSPLRPPHKLGEKNRNAHLTEVYNRVERERAVYDEQQLDNDDIMTLPTDACLRLHF